MSPSSTPKSHEVASALFCLAIAAAAGGCGDDGATPTGDAGRDASMTADAGAVLDATIDSALADSGIDHEPSAREGADMLVGLYLGVALADRLFDFDPTIDPALTADDNAARVAANVGTNLAGCGVVMVTGATVTVDLGAPPGCTFSTGLTVSGSIAVAVSKSDTTTIVAIDLSSVTVQGRALAGTLTFRTMDGSTFMLAATGGAATGLLTVAGGAGTFTIAGTLTAGTTTTPTGATLRDVVWHRGDCYPSGGSIQITHGFLLQTFTFSLSTAATGICERTIVTRTTSYLLPEYGSCPAGSPTSDAGLDSGPTDDAGADAGIDAGG